MEPQNALEEALIAAATEAQARPTFYRLMLESPLFTICDAADLPGVDGAHTLATAADLRIPTVRIEGVAHIPIFSSVERLRSWLTAERRYICMEGRALLDSVKRSPLVLNPGSTHGKQLLPGEVADMLSGAIFAGYSARTIEPSTRMALGQPAIYPKHITDPLVTFFRGTPSVAAAYLAQCAYLDSKEPPHTMIGVDASGDWEAAAERIAWTIRDAARPGEIVDVIRMDGSNIADYMRRKTMPFYKRKKFGIF